MKKYLIYFVLLAFAYLNIFASCEEDAAKRNERFKKHKIYAEKYTIYETTDSSFTGLAIYEMVLKDGHKYRYSVFEGKNKCQMEKEHLTKECKKCKTESKGK